MKKTAVILTFAAALILSVPHVLRAGEQQLTGMISDSMCGASHMSKDKTPAECTRMCKKTGSQYALVTGEKLYVLEGHKADLDKLAGQKVIVTGDLNGDTLNVSSVRVTVSK